MQQQHINLLTTKRYYQIVTRKTGRIYIDPKCSCYLFNALVDAAEFCDEHSECKYLPDAFIKQADFMRQCALCGAKFVRIRLPNEERYINIPLDDADAPRGYYSPVAVSHIINFQRTGKKKYLKEIMKEKLLACVVIEERDPGEYPSLRYVYAKLENDTKYIVLCTDLYEFQKTKGDEKYEAIEMQFDEFLDSVKHKNVIINPKTEKLVLTKNDIEKIRG